MFILRMLRGPLGIVVFGIVSVSIAVVGFLHFNPLCGEEIIQELRSPDGHYVAVWMERNCGATTGYVEHINLRAASRKFWSDFFDGTIKQDEIFGFEQRAGDSIPRIAWSGNRTLKIANACDERTRKSATWHDVSIDFTDSTCTTRTADDPKLQK
jgi:hypothetical protein